MPVDNVAAARQEGKMNDLFPTLDAAERAPAADSHHAIWDALWQDKSFLPWDQRAPHPALFDALTQRQSLLGAALPDATNSRRHRALVPGCGRGCDALVLRAFGFDVVGLDVSEAGLEQARAEQAVADAGKGAPEYAVQDAAVGLGTVEFRKGDFFALDSVGEWDLIFDYTFLCALPPDVRPQWAAQMVRLLSPRGRLVCAEFPAAKPLDSGGPPWPLPEKVYLALLPQPGKEVVYDEHGAVPDSRIEPRAPDGLERLDRWLPERLPKPWVNSGSGYPWTPESGVASEYMSVWGRRSLMD